MTSAVSSEASPWDEILSGSSDDDDSSLDNEVRIVRTFALFCKTTHIRF